VLALDHKVLLNEFVMPALPITDYVTAYSGVDAASLEGVTTTVEDIQQRLLELIDGDTILVGHGLVNDLKMVKVRHPYIIDTSVIYHHDNGPPYRASLRSLSLRYLKRHIQETNKNDSSVDQKTEAAQQTPKGHDPCEDAIASMELVQLKMEKGPKFGLHSDYLTETMVERLRQSNKTGVIIDVRPKLKSLIARKLKNHPNFYPMESNAQAVETAIQQHAVNDMVLVKLDHAGLGDTADSDDILQLTKGLYDRLEPNTVMIMLTGRYNTEELDR
jgi:RNA exonuclease 1